MKKTMKHILALVIILPFLFAGCQKSELVKETDESFEAGNLKSTIEYCGDTYVANLVDWDQTITAGTVTVGNDETNLYVTFDAADEWTFWSMYLYVGPPENAGTLYNDGTGTFNPSSFPYNIWPGGGSQLYTFTISLDELDDCFVVVAYSDAEDLSSGDNFIVWGKSNLKTSGYYFEFCKQECEVPVYDCETAYAYSEDYGTCFLDIPGVKSNNWGWSNGPIEEDSYSWPIYAGAGQCDISKATWVGTLDVVYSGGTATVTYNIDSGFTLDETHLYIGNDILAKKKNKYTTAPGQYPYSGGSSFTIDGLSGDIYVVAHSVVCGDYDE